MGCAVNERPTAAPAYFPYKHKNLAEIAAEEAAEAAARYRAITAEVVAARRRTEQADGKVWCEHCNVSLRWKQVRSCVRLRCPVRRK